MSVGPAGWQGLVMQAGEAELIAIKVVDWLAADQGMFARFVQSTGSSVEDARHRLEDPEFLAAAMDFLLSSDAAVLAFCGEHGIGDDRPLAARRMLPGGEVPHWT